MALISRDQSDSLKVEDLYHLVYVIMNSIENDRERVIFLVADRECSGVVDAEGLRALFIRLDMPAVAAEIYDTASRLHVDGEITYETFLRLLAEINRNE